jgi:hypothetical protein
MTLTKEHPSLPRFGVFFIFLPVPASLSGFCQLDQGMGKKLEKYMYFLLPPA